MGKVFLARQKIVNNSGKIFGHELFFRDSKEGIVNFPSHLKATSQVLLSALTQMDLNSIIGKEGISFVNANEEVLASDVLELLDPKRCIIEILETTDVSDVTLEKIIVLKSKGYRIALDDFDCSEEMIVKFQPLFKHLNIVKVDAMNVSVNNLTKIIPKFKEAGIRLLIEKIENTKDYLFYKELGFDLYQGYHIGKPEVLESEPVQDAVEIIIINLILMLRENKETAEIEAFIKLRPDLSYNIIKYINNQTNITEKVSSIVHAITLMGRDTLLRWLLVYLYAEVSANDFSEPLLKAAVNRAELMESRAGKEYKEKAFMIGMFSMLDVLFESDIKDIFHGLHLDAEVSLAISHQKGILGECLTKAIKSEQEHYKEVYMESFDKISSVDLLLTLEKNNIKY